MPPSVKILYIYSFNSNSSYILATIKEKERLRHDTACETQGVQSLWSCGLLLPSIAT